LCEQYQGLSEVEFFLRSFLLSLISSLLDKYVYNNKLCQFGQLFGGIVWLLPGITITIGILEIFSKMIVYGSSRLIYGISLALQVRICLMLSVYCVQNDFVFAWVVVGIWSNCWVQTSFWRRLRR
jgi:hypothetical protein